MLEKLAGSLTTSDGKRLRPFAYLLLFIMCIAFYMPGFTTLPPTDRDESSFAQASKQMIETGNYTDIRLQKEPRYKKPIGIYWLQSSIVRLLNPQHLNEIWAYRVPSFVGATVAVLMTAALGALLFTPETGLLAAIMLAACVLLNVEARLAKTDAALLGSIMVAMYALARAYLGRASRWGTPFLFWSALACGVLIKGPIILLPILGVLVWSKTTDKNILWFRALRPLPGLIYALILIAPWFVAISMQSHGAFIQQSAGNDMLHKLWQGQNRGILPPGLHLLALPIVFFPFSLFVLFALPDIWKNRHEAAVKFCLGWAVPTWIIFELSLTKLPHYVLPAYPALALLTAHFLLQGFPSVSHCERRWPVALIVTLWLMIGTGFAVAFAFLPSFVDDKWMLPQIIAGAILVIAQACALFTLPRKKFASVAILAAGSFLFMTTTFASTLPNLQHIWMSREITQQAAALHPCVHSQLVSVGYHEPSLAFLAGTDTIMAMSGAEAAEDLKQDACRIIVINAKQQSAFLDAFNGAPLQPQSSGTLNGLNSGHGATTALTLYLLPKP